MSKLAGLLLSVVVLACSSGGSDSDRAETVNVVPTATAEVTATPQPALVALTEAKLQGALLVLEDFPTGWTARAPEEDDDDDSDDLCGLSFENRIEPLVRVEAGFQKSGITGEYVCAQDSRITRGRPV